MNTNPGQEIQVSGSRCFSGTYWREAILYYLNSVWSNDQTVMYRPKINFNGITLRLDPETKTYYAYGQLETTDGDADRFDRQMREGQNLEVSEDQAAVEVGLMRFVRDDSINRLTVRRWTSPDRCSIFVLAKTMIRGEYIVYGTNLPNVDGALKLYFNVDVAALMRRPSPVVV